MGIGTLDDLVAGLARVALEPLIGLFTEGITCKVKGGLGRKTDPLWGRVGGNEAGRPRGG